MYNSTHSRINKPKNNAIAKTNEIINAKNTAKTENHYEINRKTVNIQQNENGPKKFQTM